MTPHVRALVEDADDEDQSTSISVNDPMRAGRKTEVTYSNIVDSLAAPRSARQTIHRGNKVSIIAVRLGD
jgi:hypothetical protein